MQQGQAVQYGKESAKCVQGKYRQCKEGKGRQAVQAWLCSKTITTTHKSKHSTHALCRNPS